MCCLCMFLCTESRKGPARNLSVGVAGFLDNVCTDIIHYEEKKLVHYPGNLSEFVKARCSKYYCKP